jgi:pyruvate dehydrogenase E2 component (dihydrolipoamide acetyltransferase)
MRKATAALMSRSKREIPHYYLSTTLDVSAAQDWLRATNERRPVGERLLFAALALRAVVLAAGEVPEMNGHWVDDGFRPAPAVQLGVAVSVRGGGLVAPAIRDADQLSLDELMARLRDVGRRARTGALRSSELCDPTITVTNLGDLGVESVYGVIYPPQVALVGLGRVIERPWTVGGLLGVRPVLTVTLAADHRASDGHRGGLFLTAITRHLVSPEEL